MAVIDPRGGVTRSVYDQRGRLVARIGPGGRTIRYNYDAAGRLTSLSDAGRTYQFEYDAGGNLLREVNPRGGITTRTHDPLGRLTSVRDPAGATAQFQYSLTGLLTSSIDAAGRPTQYRYDSQGRLLAAIDDAQRTTGYQYAPSGRVARVLPPSGPALDLTYDDYGRLVGVRRGKQVVVAYEYDILGRRAKEKWASGLEVAYRHDALGNVVAWEDSQGSRGTLEYDAIGRPVAVTDASGATTRFNYDPAGKWLEARDARGNVKRLAYDEAGRLTEVVEANGDKARYEYNPAGQIAVVHHPAGGKSTFGYDPLGLPTTVTDPVGGKSSSKYDAAGRLLSTTDAKGQTTTYIYDTAGRLTRKRLADGKVVSYRYDSRGNLSAVDDGAFPIRYAHDLDGRLTRVEYAAIKRTLRYEYNDAGLKTKFIDSEGRVIRYEYDAFDRLVAIKLGSGRAITFAHDARNRLTSTVYPNGVKGVRVYDDADRLTRLTYTDLDGKVVAGWTYTYDAAGNRVQTVDADGRTTRYRHDPSGQLIEEDAGRGKVVTYSYLPGGNRGTRADNGATVRYRYDRADRLLEAGRETFAHDANGNLVERKGPRGVTRYTYDAEDRLVKVVLPDRSEVRYGYAPTGERIWRRDAKGLTWFATSGLNVVAELDEKLTAKAAHVQGPGLDLPVLMIVAGREYCYHADVLGSIAALTDRTGAVCARSDHDAFGVPRARGGQPTGPFTYTGREYDRASGLYYYRARYYAPDLGRFLTRDPIGSRATETLSLNLYAYVLNNPLIHTDPMGTAPFGINMLNNRFTAPVSMPIGLNPGTTLHHYSSPSNVSNIMDTRRLWFGKPGGPAAGEVHFTETGPLRGRPGGIGTPSATNASVNVRAGDLAARGYEIKPGRQPGSWIVRKQPWQRDVELPANIRRGGGYLPRDKGSGPGDRRGAVGIPNVPEWATRTAKAGGIVLVVSNVAAGLLEGESIPEIVMENGVAMVVGVPLGALGYSVTAMLLGPTAGGVAIVGMTLYGVNATGTRLGNALGNWWSDAPVQPGHRGQPGRTRRSGRLPFDGYAGSSGAARRTRRRPRTNRRKPARYPSCRPATIRTALRKKGRRGRGTTAPTSAPRRWPWTPP